MSTSKTWEMAVRSAKTPTKIEAANKVYGLAISTAIAQLCPPSQPPSSPTPNNPLKRSANGPEGEFPIPYTIKRANTGSSDHDRFLNEQRKARRARDDFERYKNSRGHQQLVQSAQQCLQESKRKKCFFFASGRCRDGDQCLFMHACSTVKWPILNVAGELFKWVHIDAPDKSYGFIKTNRCENTYCHVSSLPGKKSPENMPCQVRAASVAKTNGQNPQASGVEYVKTAQVD
jgi:hypothetical protein